MASQSSDRLGTQHIHYQDFGDTEAVDKRRTLNIDNIIREVVGPLGLWQIMLVTMNFLTIPLSVNFPIFANTVPFHRCRLDENVEKTFAARNLSFFQVAQLIGPWVSKNNADNEHTSSVGCYLYNQNWTSTYASKTVMLNESRSGAHSTALMACPTGFVFHSKDHQYPGSVVAEFGTVCDREWLTPLSTSLYMFGMGFGYIVGGWLGDTYGRKRACIGIWLLEFIAVPAIVFAPNYWVFALGRMLEGFTISGRSAVLIVLRIEITLASYRSALGAFQSIIQSCILRALLSLYAYLLPSWRIFHAVIAMPVAFGVLYFFLPESPRWLLSQDRAKEALDVLHTGQKINSLVNRSPVSRKEADSFFESMQTRLADTDNDRKVMKDEHSSTRKKRCSFLLLTDALSRKTLLLCSLLLTGQIMCFYGIIFFARFMRAPIYLTSAINTLMALPSVVIFWLCYHFSHDRRRPIIVMYTLAAGLFTVGYAVNYVTHSQSDLALTVFANLGLILLGAVFEMMFIYIPELFPSEIRTQGLGAASGIARFGTLVFTFVNQYLEHYSHGSPMLFYAGVLIVCTAVVGLMRETSGENLSNNVNENRHDALCVYSTDDLAPAASRNCA